MPTTTTKQGVLSAVFSNGMRWALAVCPTISVVPVGLASDKSVF
jgi:hypothetical protein